MSPRLALLGLVALTLAGLGALRSTAAPIAHAANAFQIFSPTGGEQTFQVPAGVNKVYVIVAGGRGAPGTNANAGGLGGGLTGFGGKVNGYLSVTPNQTLYIEVGGNGSAGVAGFNGGGTGNFGGGGGGGASDIRTSPRSVDLNTSDTRLVVAAGSGGGGDGTVAPGGIGAGYNSGGTQTAATAGSVTPPGTAGTPGGNGTTAVGGTGGTFLGTNGSRGVGGDGGSLAGVGGGGAGGGYFGGGGGGAGFMTAGGGGGGVGASFASGSVTGAQFSNTAAPDIEIYWGDAPTLTQSFNPTTVAVNGTSTLTFTLTNPNTFFFLPLDNVTFSDIMPTGLVVATPANIVNTCGGTNGVTSGFASFDLRQVTLAPSASCTFSVDVRATGGATGAILNTTSGADSDESPAGPPSTATLTVTGSPPPPTWTSNFTFLNVTVGGGGSLVFTITNPSASTLTGVGFSDTFPAGLIVASPTPVNSNNCGGTLTAPAAATAISLSGGTLTAGQSCSVVVNVRVTQAGTITNTAGPITSTESGPGTTTTASTVVKPAAPTTVAPAITSANGVNFTQGQFGSFTVTTTGTPTPTITESGPLPAGVTFVNNGNGTATISGTPATGTVGGFPIVLTASNGVSPDATQNFTLVVNPACIGKGCFVPPPFSGPTPPQVAPSGQPLSKSIVH